MNSLPSLFKYRVLLHGDLAFLKKLRSTSRFRIGETPAADQIELDTGKTEIEIMPIYLSSLCAGMSWYFFTLFLQFLVMDMIFTEQPTTYK